MEVDVAGDERIALRSEGDDLPEGVVGLERDPRSRGQRPVAKVTIADVRAGVVALERESPFWRNLAVSCDGGITAGVGSTQSTVSIPFTRAWTLLAETRTWSANHSWSRASCLCTLRMP
jgi:hypothetical protein